jgi:coproporphyrinogen III oxidase-like Fe-S oxidoreductase
MLAERFLTNLVKDMAKSGLRMQPTDEKFLPGPKPGQKYMLYMHVPFCTVLCPYCSFNRYPYKEEIARPYFQNMRREMLMLADMGYDFESIYMGGGTPTVMLDELCETLDLARDTFHIKEVATETNPNHLVQPYLDALKGRVQRISVGVQSFNNDLLKQMDRYKKYGSGEEIYERIIAAREYFDLVNVDMIFNFPSQTEEILFNDLEKIATSGCQQTTFSPLYISNGTAKKMASALGKVDFGREWRFYTILDEVLAGGDDPMFDRSTLWTFTRRGIGPASTCGTFVDAANAGEGIDESVPTAETPSPHDEHIKEYQTNYDEYPAIGSGAITNLNGALYVNTFSLAEYNQMIESGRMSLTGKSNMSKRNLMRYTFLVNLYKLRLDKRKFKQEHGVSVERGLPVEMTFMRLNGAFETDNKDELTLTPRGRYLVVVLYRQFLSGMNNLREQARLKLSGAERELLFEGSNYEGV